MHQQNDEGNYLQIFIYARAYRSVLGDMRLVR